MIKGFLAAMVLTLAGTASAANVINSCGWNHPGSHPYKGGISKGIDNYPDIPAPIKKKLKDRLHKMEFGSVVTITRDGITGGFHPEITDMHFSANTVCRSVNREVWPKDHTEVGLVYCEDEYCIVVPTVCGNISRIYRSAPGVAIEPSIPAPKKEGNMLPGLEPKGVPWIEPPLRYDPILPGPAPTPIVEPGTAWLALIGLVIIALIKRRSKKQKR